VPPSNWSRANRRATGLRTIGDDTGTGRDSPTPPARHDRRNQFVPTDRSCKSITDLGDSFGRWRALTQALRKTCGL
jgi:hypothetical protein